ncbi:uncharacterized protein LOC144629161 isoform X1 [Oculina patagonica]
MESQNKGDSKPKKNKDDPKIKESDAQKANDVLSIEELKKQISQLKETNKGLEKTIQQQKSKINELREKNWKARDELAGAKAEKKTCRTRDTSRLRRTSSKSSVKESDAQKANDVLSIEELKKQNSQLKETNKGLEKTIQQQKSKINELREKNWKARDELAGAKAEKKTCRTRDTSRLRRTSSKSSVKESDAQKANDVLSIEELKKQNSQLKETNKGLEKTIQQQKSKINELREKNWKARDELAGAKAEKKTCRTRDTSRLRRTSSKSSVKIVITEK